MDVTEKGKQILEKKRKELESVWKEMSSAYDSKNKQLFQKKNIVIHFGIKHWQIINFMTLLSCILMQKLPKEEISMEK